MRIAALLCLVVAATARAQSPAGRIPIVIETSAGRIEAEVDSAHAPVTAANFLRYVDGKLYDAGSFFRVVTPANQPNDSVRIEVIQGGMSQAHRGDRFPAIELERTSVTGLKHVDGTLSMARGGANTATDNFFVVIGDQPSLDFGGHRNLDGQGFAAFGRVTKGMDVVRKIQAGAVNVQALVAPVTIVRVYRR
ncbi:MAG: peptidylprolyl isomerase [Gemmatimonadaceae bacterium]